MTPDEVRMLDNRYALLFIRGERPILDEKYNLLRHPNITFTTDGKGKPYVHGSAKNAVATISVTSDSATKLPEQETLETAYELLSDEEVEALFDF